ncbi:hypothetical protein H6P81_002599 [Aristolochia fimbriata]|uniref:26S proteasome non-ATPase regulatory subunit 5 n=1 Tax=Aristolochia fimbriata TaxID=158543 RepID=A0AAV7FBD3_ARIFI|nr:hypothetical protein H6P81_002599 [Aristolochia fimbriata]
MEAEYLGANADRLSLLLAAATEFASYPGMQTDASVKEFLDRFPLSVVLSVLQTEANAPEVESTLVSCLERIFKTKYGSSFIPQYMPFVHVGLQTESQIIRCLACKVVSCLLENVDMDGDSVVKLLTEYKIYPLLINCLIKGDEQLSSASTDAIIALAKSPKGIDVIFPQVPTQETHFKSIVAQCSSWARIRVLSVIVKLFSISSSVASAVCDFDLLSLIESEVNGSDMLMKLSAFELLYELAESPNAMKFFSRTKFVQMLVSTISDVSIDSVLRSRAMSICGRLLSLDGMLKIVDPMSLKNILLAIDAWLESLKNQGTDECECALEVVGQIGSSIEGANLLLLQSPALAGHVVEAAFDQQARGQQLAALHALADICGEKRSESQKLLTGSAEECLRHLIYTAARNSSKLTPSGLFVSVLRQDSEVRLAAYRMISGLVSRPWCLLEVCTKQDIVDMITNPQMETTKIAMEARFNCCTAINKAFQSSTSLSGAAFSEVASKLQEAVRRGPYLARERAESVPVVATADRF